MLLQIQTSVNGDRLDLYFTLRISHDLIRDLHTPIRSDKAFRTKKIKKN